MTAKTGPAPLQTLAAISAEIDGMTGTLSQQGWQSAWSRENTPRMDSSALRHTLAQPETADAPMRAAAIQIEKRQRRLIRLITHRMLGLREDLREISLLSTKLDKLRTGFETHTLFHRAQPGDAVRHADIRMQDAS